MASLSMDMSGLSSITSAVASATSAMSDMMSTTASSVMSMASASASSSMDSMDMSSDSSSMSMNMYLTTAYANYPVLFKQLSADTSGKAFGIFVLMFVVSFLSKGIEFFKNYLEQKVWDNPNYQVATQTTVIEQCDCDEDDKVSLANEGVTASGSHKRASLSTVLFRDLVRILLCFVSELLGYAMMLVAMTFSLVYFFAVVLGMAFGRFFFERLSDLLNVRPGGNNFQGHH